MLWADPHPGGAKTLGEGGLSLDGEVLRRKDKQTVLIKSFLHIRP